MQISNVTVKTRGPARERIAMTLLLAVLVLSAVAAPPASGQGRGFSLEGLSGGQIQQRDLNQGAVIVVVWASWSPRGRDIISRTNEIADRWGSQARVIMVNFQEDKATVESFLQGNQAKAPIFLDRDGAFSKNYSVTHLPGLLIFKDGVTAFSGKLPPDANSLIAQTLG
jgi:thiol-disulfide isomerase/thioredoxin